MKKVVVGLSGGVDSSVAAYVLKQQGYDVVGVFMINWHDTSVTISDECPWLDDSNDAMMVAEKLGIPYQVVDLSERYHTKVVDYMFSEYEKGRTPNPDVLCNREIKFAEFMDIAIGLGADFVATGHYARKGTEVINGKEVYKLLAGKDNNKDQSYFLCQLSQKQLEKTLFPIGEMTKPEVREIAKELDLITADKKDSQGICFVGKVKLPDFLKQQLKPKDGNIVEMLKSSKKYIADKTEFSSKEEELKFLSDRIIYTEDDGEIVGIHQGAHFYTKGQRKGLGVGGKVEPLFVIETDVKSNTVYTGQGHNHPGLLKRALFISSNEIHWVREDLKLQNGETLNVSARIRYRQPLQKAIIYMFETGMYIEFEEYQSAISEGQFAAWYIDDELIGSGVIN
ncbi:MAG: tRNA 2-thiouridine(34) synthase MnmA [Ichthyobacteriaceae bacterium]|nr:tRNA 2-thiouridine(34) synthase MnmA [Ichthyobacteriaceae bacterium]